MNKFSLPYTCVFCILLVSCRENGIGPPTPLPEYVSIDDAPSWSPQGNLIAYFHFNRDHNDTVYPTGLYIIDTSGENRRLVIAGLAYNPDWSPDGQRIAFQSGDIFTITTTGDSLTRVTYLGQAHLPSWSPDGLRIVFDRSGTADTVGIWTVEIQSGIERRISIGGMPDWSSNGEKFLHTRSLVNVFGEKIFVMDTLGNNPVRLTLNQLNDRYPKWSPDGTKIAWTSGRNIDQIWVMNTDGSSQRKITDGEKPSWSSDGSRPVFSRPQGDKIVLFITDLNSGVLKQLTN